METEQQSRLFPCNNRKLLYPNLEGVSFKIHSEIDFDALCVWGGPLCTFDAMTKFVQNRAMDPATKIYQFGITEMVSQIPSRITAHTLPTITISVKSNTGIGPAPLAESFQKVTRGFEPGTWAVVFVFLFLLLFLVYIVSIRFTGSLSFFSGYE